LLKISEEVCFMSKRSDAELLQDIEEAITRIIAYTTKMSYGKFLADKKTQDAVVRNLEIVGEAVKGLSAILRKKHSSIPWKNIAGMRDRLIHDYSGVNLDIVWGVVKDELPGLVQEARKILRGLK